MSAVHRLSLRQINENPTLMSDEVFIPEEEHDALVAQLLAALRAQHEAIDRLFAMLIAKTMYAEKPFYPSESGQPWEAMLAGKAAIEAMGETI
jgi:hypothetical protein